MNHFCLVQTDLRSPCINYAHSCRPGGEGGNGPPEGKFMKLGGKVNFGVLSSKIDVIRAKKGTISLVNSSFLRFNVCIQMKGGSSPPIRCN